MHPLKTLTMNEAMGQFLLDRQIEGCSPDTIRNYRNFLRPLQAFLGDSPVDRINSASLRHYLAESQDDHPYSNRYRYVVLRALCNWCVRQDYWLTSPLRSVAPRSPKSIIPIFNDDEIKQMLAIDPGPCTQRNRAIVLLLFDTGLRVSELLSMQIKDIDWDARQIRIWGKGARQRVSPFSQAVGSALKSVIGDRKSGHVWLSQRGQCLTVSGAEQAVKYLARRAGIQNKRTSPHVFRHTCTCNLLAAGASETEVQYLMGWESITMLERYSRATKAQRALKAHERFSPVDRLGLK